MYIKRSIKFLLHKRKPGDTMNLGIRMRVTIKGKKPIDFPTGHKVNLEDWNYDNERVKEDSIDNKSSEEINRTIDEYRSVMNEIFARFELLEKRVPSKEEVKTLFDDLLGRSKQVFVDDQVDIFKTFDLFIRVSGEQNQWSDATFTKFNTLRKHLEKFDPELQFNTITEEKLQQYIYFLYKKKQKNTTIQKSIEYVKWFLRWAKKKGYYMGIVHETFKPRFKGVDGNSKEIIYLTKDELEKLHEYNGKEYLERVRDVFLFCCYTGLRYSDVANLTRSDVSSSSIRIVTQKTTDALTIELNRHSKAILEKYKKDIFPNDLALPVISNPKMNEYLKELGQECELNMPHKVVYFSGNQRHEEIFPKWALLTTHCGRRTFVVNALILGIPAEVIMRWTGHADYKSMRPYVKIVDELKKQEMSKFDKL